MRHGYVEANGIRIHYVEEGEGPPVVLLHGFPEFWYGWRRQIPILAAAGFRTIAPDLRGYNETERPAGVESYRLDLLVADVAGLMERLGASGVVLVGHDWGGVIAWYAAMHHPSLVERLVVMNAPHPATYRRELRRMSSQVLRSGYAAFFQLPWLPEALWRAGDFALLRRAVRSGPARTDEEAEAYVEALARPGALSAALHYYRAAARHRPPRTEPVTVPTLVIWGERDPFLVSALADGLEPWVRDLRVERLPRATHWLHHEQPETVGRLIADFARGGAAPGP